MFFTVCCVGQESDLFVLGLILRDFAVNGVVHEFEERLLHRELGGGMEINILCDVDLQTALFLELDNPVDLGQQQTVLDIEFQIEVFGDSSPC